MRYSQRYASASKLAPLAQLLTATLALGACVDIDLSSSSSHATLEETLRSVPPWQPVAIDSLGGTPLPEAPDLDSLESILVQARPGQCLASRSFPPDPGSTLTMNACNGSPQQQVLRNGQLLNIGDLCISARTNNQPVLEACDTSKNSQLFTAKANGALGLVHSTQVFDVTADQRILTYGAHGGNNQRFAFLSELRSDLADYEPVVDFPITDSLRASEQAELDALNAIQPPAIQPYDRSALLHLFAGQVPADAERVAVRFPVDRRFNNGGLRGWSAQPRNWTFSRTYAAPGDIVRIHVEGRAEEADGLYAVLNVRTDVLRLGHGNSGSQLKRPGNLSLRVALQAGDNYVRNPYGGSIVIESSGDHDRTVWVQVAGGVRQPFFDLGSNNDEDWHTARHYPAPFAILQGPQIAIGLYDRQRWEAIEQPTQLMENYERVMELSRHITGFDRNGTGVHRWPDGRQFLVQDVEISAGFAHAGFPIMAQPGFRIDRLTDSVFSWGVAHEIGHNYQHQCLSSYRYGVESTVNVWSSYVEEQVGLEARIERDGRYDSAISRFGTVTHFTDFNVWEQLVFQMQMIYGLPGGWDNYRNALRYLRELPETQRNQICNSDQAQWDIWYEVMSTVSGYDLTAHFDTWQVPLSANARTQVAALNLPNPPTNLSQIRGRPY
ncbi:MAG: M60 family metallopeptidase [Marinobacter sp.]|nr:M60 family metallopeptidase [Marinobacter sp.]